MNEKNAADVVIKWNICCIGLCSKAKAIDETLTPTEVKDRNMAAAREMANAGAFFSRPYGHWTDFAYGSNIETVNVQRDIKSIFDPTGIMNPGRLCF